MAIFYPCTINILHVKRIKISPNLLRRATSLWVSSLNRTCFLLFAQLPDTVANIQPTATQTYRYTGIGNNTAYGFTRIGNHTAYRLKGIGGHFPGGIKDVPRVKVTTSGECSLC